MSEQYQNIKQKKQAAITKATRGISPILLSQARLDPNNAFSSIYYLHLIQNTPVEIIVPYLNLTIALFSNKLEPPSVKIVLFCED